MFKITKQLKQIALESLPILKIILNHEQDKNNFKSSYRWKTFNEHLGDLWAVFRNLISESLSLDFFTVIASACHKTLTPSLVGGRALCDEQAQTMAVKEISLFRTSLVKKHLGPVVQRVDNAIH